MFLSWKTTWYLYNQSINHLFTDKDNIRKDNPGKFLGFVTFLCQVFGNMRTAKGEPFTVLSTPIYDCVYIIINDDSSSDDDYECLILQVSMFLAKFSAYI